MTVLSTPPFPLPVPAPGTIDRSSSASPADLEAALTQHNPFNRHLFVTSQEVWEQSFPDAIEVNRPSFEAIVEAVTLVQSDRRPTLGLTLSAPKGAGKSHLLSRYRRHWQQTGGSLFIYAGEFSTGDRVNADFLNAVVHSLKQVGPSGVAQWQELAAALVNRGFGKTFQPAKLVTEFFPNQMRQLANERRAASDWITNLRKRLQALFPSTNPDLLQAILWTLSASYAPYAIDWIKGQGLAQWVTEDLKLPVSLTDELDSSGDPEATDSYAMAIQILRLIHCFHPVVICLDGWDNHRRDQDSQLPGAIATLANNLLTDLQRTVVITAVTTETWHRVQPTLPPSLSARIAEQHLTLAAPTPDTALSLITHWLTDFYRTPQLTPPTAVYPFTPEELQDITTTGSTFKAVLQLCRDQLQDRDGAEAIAPQPETHNHPVAIAYEEERNRLSKQVDDYMDNEAILAEALKLGFQALVGKTVGAGIEVRQVTEITAKAAANYVQFVVCAKEDQKLAKIGVAVNQVTNGATVLSGLKRLVEPQHFGIEITRGCLVRSKSISPTAKQAQEYAKRLLANKGEWVALMQEHILPLLAIKFVIDYQEDYGVSEAQIFDFMEQQQLAADNPLLLEILSKPTGKVPETITNIEQFISRPGLSSASNDAVSSVRRFDTITCKPLPEWVYSITTLADRSSETDERKSNYHAGTDFENIVRHSLSVLGFTIATEHNGGAGGLDFVCRHPFTVVGECKSGKSIPSGTVEQLLKLGGTHLGTDGFQQAVKLIIGPGQPTSELLKTAQAWNVSLMSAIALQKLVETKVKYPGLVNLLDLKEYLRAGSIDSCIEDYLEQKIRVEIRKRSTLMAYLKQYQQLHYLENVEAEALYTFCTKQDPLFVSSGGIAGDREFLSILNELASPFLGCLQRRPSSTWWLDRYSFQCDLPDAVA